MNDRLVGAWVRGWVRRCVGGLHAAHDAAMHSYGWHNYIDQNYTGHTYICCNYIGHNYIGRNYAGYNYIWAVTIHMHPHTHTSAHAHTRTHKLTYMCTHMHTVHTPALVSSAQFEGV